MHIQAESAAVELRNREINQMKQIAVKRRLSQIHGETAECFDGMLGFLPAIDSLCHFLCVNSEQIHRNNARTKRNRTPMAKFFYPATSTSRYWPFSLS